MEFIIWFEQAYGSHIPFMLVQIILTPISDGIDLIDIMDTNG
jgi:hypothetical protein